MPDRELPWPKPGTKAFAPPPDGERKFVFLDWPPRDLGPGYYATAYKIGADAVVAAAERDSGHPDMYFYTAGFLYRHFIELSLKECILIGSELHDNERKAAHGHDLDKLWRLVRQYLEKTWPDAPTEDCDAAGQIIMEFDQVDPTNEEFRYPVTNRGSKSLEKAPRRLDLGNLKARMEELDSYFTGAIDGMAHQLDYRRDYEAEMRAQMPRGDEGH